MSIETINYILASMIIGILHGSIPNHWITFVILSQKEKWNHKKLLIVSIISAILHNISTIILGFFVITIGNIILKNFIIIEKTIPTIIFIFLGNLFLMSDKKHKKNISIKDNQNTKGIIFILWISMFFSPCLEIQSIYFSISKNELHELILISIIYGFLSTISILFFTMVANKSIKILYSKFIIKYEKKIIGITFIVLGIFNLFY